MINLENTSQNHKDKINQGMLTEKRPIGKAENEKSGEKRKRSERE